MSNDQPSTDWGSLDPRAAAAIERALQRSVADGLEEFMTDPARVAKVMSTFLEVAASRGAEESGRWLWRKVAGLAWTSAKGLAIIALILYAGGGLPAVMAFLKLKGGA